MVSRLTLGFRRRLTNSPAARVRGLAAVVAALGVGTAAFAVVSTLAATRHEPPTRVPAAVFTTPSPPGASPSGAPLAGAVRSPAAPLPPRCRTSQLAVKGMSYAGFPSPGSAYLFLLRDRGPEACSLSGAPTISWPRGVEASLVSGLLTASPPNDGRGATWFANGHPIRQIGPVILTPGGTPVGFFTVEFPGPGVKNIWACITSAQDSLMPSWLYITLPGAVHSLAVPNSLSAPGRGCWTFGGTTAIYPTGVLVKGMSWGNSALTVVPTDPIVLPPGTPSRDLG